jgi:uncharacterized protein (TIGR02001 family)
MKNFLSALLISSICLMPLAASAEDKENGAVYDFFANPSGTVAVTSDYVFRGITQSDESPALQGAINFGQATGPYLGLWGSNVDFNDGDEATLELDLSGGYKWAWGPASFDAGVIYYAYPGADSGLDYDYWEGKLAASVPAGPVTVTGSAFVSPDYFAGSGTAVYVNGAASVPVFSTGITANAAVGHQSIDDNAAFGTSDYTDWTGGLSYTWEKFTFNVAYYDTDLSNADCPDGCEARAVATITCAFP